MNNMFSFCPISFFFSAGILKIKNRREYTFRRLSSPIWQTGTWPKIGGSSDLFFPILYSSQEIVKFNLMIFPGI